LDVSGNISTNSNYKIDDKIVLSANGLGEDVIKSYLTQVGQLVDLTVETSISANQINTTNVRVTNATEINNMYIHFLEVSDESYVINKNYNIIFLNNTQFVYLPENAKNGAVIHLNNCSDNTIMVRTSPTIFIFHYILTPPEGLNEILLTKNTLLKFVYTNVSSNGFSKWNIIC
jgi:hypothetical protein